MAIFNDPKNGLGGVPENVYSTKEENIKKKKYLFDYLKSTKYKERLTKEMPNASEKEVQAEINKRKQNLKNIGVEIVKDPLDPRGRWGGTLGTYWPSELTKEELQRGEKPSHIQLEPHSTWSHKNINLEEYSHALEGGTKGGERITEKTKNLIESVTVTPSEDPTWGVDHYEKYITTPTEFTAAMQGVRYMMKERGIYDPSSEDFTEEHYKELMEGDHPLRYDTHFERLWDSLKGDEKQKKKSFIKVMNEIAAVEPQDDSSTLAKGVGKESYMAKQQQITT